MNKKPGDWEVIRLFCDKIYNLALQYFTIDGMMGTKQNQNALRSVIIIWLS